jgi:hypothetical protein
MTKTKQEHEEKQPQMRTISIGNLNQSVEVCSAYKEDTLEVLSDLALRILDKLKEENHDDYSVQ